MYSLQEFGFILDFLSRAQGIERVRESASGSDSNYIIRIDDVGEKPTNGLGQGLFQGHGWIQGQRAI